MSAAVRVLLCADDDWSDPTMDRLSASGIELGGRASSKLRIKCSFDNSIDENRNVPVFKEGLAAVELNGYFGFVDYNGKMVVPCKYTNDYYYALPEFSNGIALIRGLGYIGIDGTEYWED